MPEKKEEKPKLTKIPGLGRDLRIDATCGSCIFYKRFGYYTLPDDQKREKIPCRELDVEENSKPCQNYSIDPTLIRFRNAERSVEQLRTTLSRIPTKNLSLFAAFVNQEQRTRRLGYTFGDSVFIRLFGDDYLSNYAEAWIIRATKDYVYVQGRKGFDGTFFNASIMTEVAFEKKKADLQKKGLLIDPNFRRHTSVLLDKEELKKQDYRPQTIDAYMKTEIAKVKPLKDPDEFFDDKKSLLSKAGKAKIVKIR